MRASRPGIASANRPRQGSFASLLLHALDDQSALDGLLFAYTELPVAERRALVQAIVQDADDPSRPLLALLAVEEEPPLQQRLAALLSRFTSVQRSAFIRSTESGAEGRGEAWLVQSLLPEAPEALRITWKRDEIEQIQLKSLDDARFESFTEVDIADAVELLTPLLWQHLRTGGERPTELRRFAGFFSSVH